MGAKQRGLHIFGEILGILLGIFLIYSFTQIQDSFIRWSLLIFGILSIIIDGWFLTTWRKK